MEKKLQIAAKNLLVLQNNVYPGPGIIVGLDQTGDYIVQIYWINGRSTDSQNRVFSIYGGFVETVPIDPETTKDSSPAMAEKNLRYVVSNGRQTLSVLNGTASCDLEKLLRSWTYEPDKNFTPRIASLINLGKLNEYFTVEFGILSKSAFDEKCERNYFTLPLSLPGMGYCIHTYSGDGNPLPPFEGVPYLVPLVGDIEELTNSYWDILNPENRVALAVKFIDTRSGKSVINIKNRFEEISVAV